LIVDQANLVPSQQQQQESKAIKIEAPSQSASTPSQASNSNSIPSGTVPQLSTIPGTAFPAQKTSTIDVNGNPVYPPVGKPITQVDLDADLAEEQRIWRHPGQDQSDYFNYGFDEFTWETYRQRQITMADTKTQSEVQLKQFQQMMGGGNNGPPSGMSAVEQQHMEMVMQQMMAQNMDISQVDTNTFMQMAGQMAGQGMPGPGFGGPGGPQGGFQQGNQGGGRGGRGGRGRGW
jgi:pre-mRNA 3'-end-processing factor FIP1